MCEKKCSEGTKGESSEWGNLREGSQREKKKRATDVEQVTWWKNLTHHDSTKCCCLFSFFLGGCLLTNIFFAREKIDVSFICYYPPILEVLNAWLSISLFESKKEKTRLHKKRPLGHTKTE
jgi:hypothetical protein